MFYWCNTKELSSYTFNDNMQINFITFGLLLFELVICTFFWDDIISNNKRGKKAHKVNCEKCDGYLNRFFIIYFCQILSRWYLKWKKRIKTKYINDEQGPCGVVTSNSSMSIHEIRSFNSQVNCGDLKDDNDIKCIVCTSFSYMLFD